MEAGCAPRSARIRHASQLRPETGNFVGSRGSLRECANGTGALAGAAGEHLFADVQLRLGRSTSSTPRQNRQVRGTQRARSGRAPINQSWVGRRGLEPLTPCVSCKCATNCANGPSPVTLAVELRDRGLAGYSEGCSLGSTRAQGWACGLRARIEWVDSAPSQHPAAVVAGASGEDHHIPRRRGNDGLRHRSARSRSDLRSERRRRRRQCGAHRRGLLPDSRPPPEVPGFGLGPAVVRRLSALTSSIFRCPRC